MHPTILHIPCASDVYKRQAMVRGIQSQHIGASVKHFAANNKETNRKDSDSRVSAVSYTHLYRDISAKMLATCLHMMQGTPYVYQGEELGKIGRAHV